MSARDIAARHELVFLLVSSFGGEIQDQAHSNGRCAAPSLVVMLFAEINIMKKRQLITAAFAAIALSGSAVSAKGYWGTDQSYGEKFAPQRDVKGMTCWKLALITSHSIAHLGDTQKRSNHSNGG